MRFVVIPWSLSLVLLPSASLRAADEPVAFKDMRTVKTGDREKVEVNDSSVSRVSTIVANKVVDVQTSRAGEKVTYSVEYLGSDANPFAKQIVAFEKVGLVEEGKVVSLKLDGKKLVVERRDGKTGYRLADGNDLGDREQEYMRGRFGDDATDNSSNSGGGPGGSLIAAFWPKKAVALNKSWPCDTDLLAKQALSAFEGLTLDADKSKGQGTLLKVYDLGGVSYARIKIEAKIAILRSESKTQVMKFDPPLVAEFSGTYDACIDGTTGNMTGDVKWSARGTARVKSADGEETLGIDITGTTYKKYTLLKK